MNIHRFILSFSHRALREKICIIRQCYIRIIFRKWFRTIRTLITDDSINHLKIYQRGEYSTEMNRKAQDDHLRLKAKTNRRSK